MLQGRFNQYFHGNAIYNRLIALRFAMFGLIAYDMWTIMLPHASRYGAGNFNVAQIGLLDFILPVPTPGIVSVIVMSTGAMLGLIACGAVNKVLAYTAVGYFGLYLWSQADRFSTPLSRRSHALHRLFYCPCPDGHRGIVAPHRPPIALMPWALQLIYVQIALVYFWTAVTKLDATVVSR